MRFTTTVELGGKTATGFEVPAEVVEALGQGKQPPVTVALPGHAYRSTVAARGGRFLLPLSAENREAAGLSAGDEVSPQETRSRSSSPSTPSRAPSTSRTTWLQPSRPIRRPTRPGRACRSAVAGASSSR